MNNAGGYVFAVSDETRVRRFLILGCASPTYYAKQEELVLDNLNALLLIIEKGLTVSRTLDHSLCYIVM